MDEKQNNARHEGPLEALVGQRTLESDMLETRVNGRGEPDPNGNFIIPAPEIRSDTPQWDANGEPMNLLAAAEDAYEWLTYLRSHSRALRIYNPQWDKLDRCMEMLRGFMTPNADYPTEG